MLEVSECPCLLVASRFTDSSTTDPNLTSRQSSSTCQLPTMGGTKYIGWEALMPCEHLNTPEDCRREDCPFSHDESLSQPCFKQACKHLRSTEGCPLREQCPFSHEPSGPTESRTLEQGNRKATHRAIKNTVFAPGPQNRGPPLAVAKK